MNRIGVDPTSLVADAAPTSSYPTVNYYQPFRFFKQAQATEFAPFVLTNRCPDTGDYDSGAPVGSARETHRFGGPVGYPAVIMRVDSLDDLEGGHHPFQTIMMPFSWMDVAELPGTVYVGGDARRDLAYRILTHAIPLNCNHFELVDAASTADVPRTTALHLNAPNPFNPSTVIRFDLAERCQTTLRIYDLGGRLVRSLVREELPAGRRSII
jgi:hypothetical protein